MAFKLGTRSRNRLRGVHPHLVAIVERAFEISDQDFTVLEGVRSLRRQRKLVAKGASKTMRSRHLKAPNGYGHAVDLAPYPTNGDFDEDGILNIADWDEYYPIEVAMKQAANELGYPITWGGDWPSFKDGPHWQLTWKHYPGK